jgi:hypothetical protein
MLHVLNAFLIVTTLAMGVYAAVGTNCSILIVLVVVQLLNFALCLKLQK